MKKLDKIIVDMLRNKQGRIIFGLSLLAARAKNGKWTGEQIQKQAKVINGLAEAFNVDPEDVVNALLSLKKNK